MGSGWGPTITVVQDPNRLQIEYAVFSRYDLQPPLQFTYALDGSETRNAVMMGRGEQVESSRARWEGATLVIVTTFRVEDRAAASPFTAELTRRLHLAMSLTATVVSAARRAIARRSLRRRHGIGTFDLSRCTTEPTSQPICATISSAGDRTSGQGRD